MRRLRIKRDTHRDAVCGRHELDDAGAVAEGILDQLVWHDLGIRSGKVKAEATVLGFHAGRELPTHAQIDRGFCRVPIVRRRVPLLDVLWRGVSAPDVGNRGIDEGFNGYFHDLAVSLLEPASSAWYRNDERGFRKSTSSCNFFDGSGAGDEWPLPGQGSR